MLTLSPLPNTGGTGAKFALQRHRTGAMLWLCWEETCQPLSSQHQLQPTLILLLHKWYVSSSEDFYKYQELKAHERWTQLLSLSSFNFHSTRAQDMQGICCPWGCEQHQQCWQVPSFLTPLLGEAFKRQQKCHHLSSESCHPKHSYRTDFMSQKLMT